jgi:hypothetical protein
VFGLVDGFAPCGYATLAFESQAWLTTGAIPFVAMGKYRVRVWAGITNEGMCDILAQLERVG